MNVRQESAAAQFRRVNGHVHLAALREELQRHVAAETVSADCYKRRRCPKRAASEVLRNSGVRPGQGRRYDDEDVI